MAPGEKGEKTVALASALPRCPALFLRQEIEHGVHHIERNFARNGQRRSAQQKIVEMLDRFIADEEL